MFKKLIYRLRTLAFIAITLAIVFFILGCGTLDRKIDADRLYQDDLSYGQGLGPEDGGEKLKVQIGKKKVCTEQTAYQDIIIFPLLISSKTFGYDEKVGNFGYAEADLALPVYNRVSESIYNQDGIAIAQTKNWELFPFYRYGTVKDLEKRAGMENYAVIPIPILNIFLFGVTTKTKDGQKMGARVEIFRLPLIGPCIAFGKGDHKLFWLKIGN